MNDPSWVDEVMECEQYFLKGKPIHAIWSTMEKREKKSSPLGPRGSRMIVYLPIGMRLTELKNLGGLIELTKSALNPCGVSGMGLHDYGKRMKRLWKEKSLHNYIAGWGIPG